MNESHNQRCLRLLMSGESVDWDTLLEPTFDAKKFGNDLLKSVHVSNLSTTQLDLNTPVKRLNYELQDVEAKIDQLIKNHPGTIFDQLRQGIEVNETIASDLETSLNYLDMSRNRLQEQIVGPYERAQKLQSALRKVHQTSRLLRDSLMCIHLIQKLSMSDTNSLNQWDAHQWLEMALIHDQLRYIMNENANLKSLKLIKQLHTTVVHENAQVLTKELCMKVLKECLNHTKLRDNKESIAILCKGLYMINMDEFFMTMQKIIISNINACSQMLLKTLTVVKNFPDIFKEVVIKAYGISVLESILLHSKVASSNLLTEFTNKSKNPKGNGMTPRDLFWRRVGNTFGKELGASIERGGPVGKSLQANKDLIYETIQNAMKQSAVNQDYEKDMKTLIDLLKFGNRI